MVKYECDVCHQPIPTAERTAVKLSGGRKGVKDLCGVCAPRLDAALAPRGDDGPPRRRRGPAS